MLLLLYYFHCMHTKSFSAHYDVATFVDVNNTFGNFHQKFTLEENCRTNVFTIQVVLTFPNLWWDMFIRSAM